MNADAFRHFYDYHFVENRKLWESYVTALSYDICRCLPGDRHLQKCRSPLD